LFDVQTLVGFFQSYGYASVFGVLILCGLGLPIPEDISLIAGGIISGLGYTNVHVMFGISMAGVLLGDSIIFFIGRRFGEKFFEKHHVVGSKISHKRILAIQKWFEKYGKRVIFVGRFLPGLRALIFATAGITCFCSYRTFILIDGFAAIISVPIWVYLGHYGATRIDSLMEWIYRGKIGVACVAGVAIIIFAIAALVKRKIKKLEEKLDTAVVEDKPAETCK
jgi:membrane protein DedA with SNARE-associated domain